MMYDSLSTAMYIHYIFIVLVLLKLVVKTAFEKKKCNAEFLSLVLIFSIFKASASYPTVFKLRYSSEIKLRMENRIHVKTSHYYYWRNDISCNVLTYQKESNTNYNSNSILIFTVDFGL